VQHQAATPTWLALLPALQDGLLPPRRRRQLVAALVDVPEAQAALLVGTGQQQGVGGGVEGEVGGGVLGDLQGAEECACVINTSFLALEEGSPARHATMQRTSENAVEPAVQV
jgi:hypothetical protein